MNYRSNLRLVEINMSSLSTFEQEQITASTSTDPLEVYIKKIEQLADALDCSEADAEAIILNRVGNHKPVGTLKLRK